MNKQTPEAATDRELSPHLFRNRNFVLLWIGRTISVLGDNIYAIALMWWVLEKTNSTAMMATVAICWTVPAVALGIIAGTYADRVNRKKLIIWMDLGRACLIAIPATLLFFGLLEVWHIFIITILESSMSTFFGPSISAFLPSLVRKEDLTRANSMFQLSFNLSGILGQALGGILMAVVGAAMTIYLDAISFFVSALSIISISTEITAPQTSIERKDFLRDLKDGLIYIRQNQFIWGIISLAVIINFLFAPFGIYMPVMVKSVFKMGPQGFGYLGAAVSLGMLAGSLFLSIKGQIKRKGLVIVGSVCLMGLCISFFGITQYFILSLLLLALMGVFMAFANTLIVVVFQSQVPTGVQGRVFGTTSTFAQGLQPISLALAGVLSDLFKVQFIILTSGILAFLVGIYGFFIKGIRDA
ncbi:MAG TPA: MFS transporter [candidate division Zixibacteria bacterium]